MKKYESRLDGRILVGFQYTTEVRDTIRTVLASSDTTVALPSFVISLAAAGDIIVPNTTDGTGAILTRSNGANDVPLPDDYWMLAEPDDNGGLRLITTCAPDIFEAQYALIEE